jgi:hypothetical protein
MEGSESFATGHLALGYIVAMVSAKLTKTRFSIPLIFTLSIIPDLDFLVTFLRHGGSSHSIILAIIIFAPVFAICGKRTIPYFLAVVQHSLLGDYFGGGAIQLFWPITRQYYGLSISTPTIVLVEWLAFVTSMVIMLKSLDMMRLFKPCISNLILFIPTLALLLPTFANYPLIVPVWLIPPHLVYMFIFVASMIITVANVRLKMNFEGV